MDPYPPESSDRPPAAEDFVHIENPNPNVEALSESIVDVADELRVETGADIRSVSEPRRTELPEGLSKSVVVLKCESTAESGSCDVYLVGTAHVSQVNMYFFFFLKVGFSIFCLVIEKTRLIKREIRFDALGFCLIEI